MIEYLADDIIRSYNRKACSYDRLFGEQKYIAHEILASEVAKIFNIAAKPLRILDVGIGTGLLAECFKAQNPDCHITGIDFASDMLKECRKKKIADNLIETNIQTQPFPFEDGEFDLVVSSGVFELLDKPDQVIKEMGRVLRPSGVFSFTAYVDSTQMDGGNIHSEETIKNSLTNSGLKVKGRQYFPAFNVYEDTVYYHLYTGTKAPANLPQKLALTS